MLEGYLMSTALTERQNIGPAKVLFHLPPGL
jgi:hypothetical protein